MLSTLSAAAAAGLTVIPWATVGGILAEALVAAIGALI